MKNEHEQYLLEQPNWLQLLTKQKTYQERLAIWRETLQPAQKEFNRNLERLMMEAAAKFGYSSHVELKNLLKHRETIPSEEKDRTIKASIYVNKNIVPYQQAVNEASKLYIEKQQKLEVDFIKKFNAFAEDKVNDVVYYPNNDNKWLVRCKINGEQQMGKPLSEMDSVHRKEDGKWIAKNMAVKYFAEEICAAMTDGQIINKGLKR